MAIFFKVLPGNMEMAMNAMTHVNEVMEPTSAKVATEIMHRPIVLTNHLRL